MKISILTISYNSDKYIERAINSVLIQTYPNYEHIIVDGNSTDNTVSIISRYKHIHYISEPDEGQSDAMNKAFNLSSGDIIVYLNADDEFLEGTFETVINAFNNNPGVDMIVGDLIFKTDKESVRRVPSDKYSKIIQYWLNLFPNNPVSYFYKRKVQSEIGDFPIDNHYAMDIWFLLKAYKKFKIKKIDAIFGIFHSDGTNKTANADTGLNLHKNVKNHLLKENPLLIIYFYTKLIMARMISTAPILLVLA